MSYSSSSSASSSSVGSSSTSTSRPVVAVGSQSSTGTTADLHHTNNVGASIGESVSGLASGINHALASGSKAALACVTDTVNTNKAAHTHPGDTEYHYPASTNTVVIGK